MRCDLSAEIASRVCRAPRATDRKQKTPLLVLCDAVGDLLADKKRTDEQLAAAEDTLHEMAQAILHKSPDCIDLDDNRGWTPLQTAAEWGSLKLVKLLLDHGARVNLSDHAGLTPLHWAVSCILARTRTVVLRRLRP